MNGHIEESRTSHFSHVQILLWEENMGNNFYLTLFPCFAATSYISIEQAGPQHGQSKKQETNRFKDTWKVSNGKNRDFNEIPTGVNRTETIENNMKRCMIYFEINILSNSKLINKGRKQHEMILAETENLQKMEIQLEQENAFLRSKIAENERLQELSMMPAGVLG
ncbi:agamous-like MADS-box protein AGL11 [Lycium barbarum]|uniref:agamous-like MADS-box protein AGL11 n=1 Tax=Lycium barbarum TaxID=112863 RepID=UPI00293F56C6|nr:agamous-like MADS-box protein AGL11 [Lycium barbarum]